MSGTKVHWKLMSSFAIDQEDRRAMSKFIMDAPFLTQSEQVKKFEKEWSKWQGCKYSVFVNSGSSANLLLMDAMRKMFGLGSCVCQAITWSTNVAPVSQVGMDLQLCDVSLSNLGPDLDSLEHICKTSDVKFLFLTHLIGIPAITERLLSIIKEYDLILLEDCCESVGAMYNNKKIGNFGLGSTFSFYYGHHMTTIEGGMICTDSEDLYNELLLSRSHGLLRELPDKVGAQQEVDGVDPSFTFLTHGYNVRNTEINAFLGRRQLQSLDRHIRIRNTNYHRFMSDLGSRYRKFEDSQLSSFCLPICCEDISHRRAVEECLRKHHVEYRPLVSGNLHRQPFMQHSINNIYQDNAEYLHNRCVYIGNHQHVNTNMVNYLVLMLNRI